MILHHLYLCTEGANNTSSLYKLVLIDRDLILSGSRLMGLHSDHSQVELILGHVSDAGSTVEFTVGLPVTRGSDVC